MSPPSTVAQRALPALAAALATALLALALAGRELVPAAAPDYPRWILGPFGDGLGVEPPAYLALLLVAIGLWALLVAALARAELPPRRLIGAIAAAIALFALAPPLLSLDLFSYLSYARLAAEGLNPYEAAPADLPGDPAAERVDDFRGAVSVYGPLFTLLTLPLGLTGAGLGLWALKALAAAWLAAIVALTIRIAGVRGVPALPAAAFVGLNPMVLVHIVGGGHNDGAMVALALAGVLAVLTARPAAAGLAFVAAAATKATGGLLLPFALLGGPGRGRLAAAAAAAAALGLALSLALFGGAAFEALGVAGGNQETVSRWSVPATATRISGLDVDLVRALFLGAYLVALAGLLVWVGRGGDWLRGGAWATFGLLVATAWMVPWYLIWLVPLAAVARDRVLLVLTVALTLFQAPNAIPL
jgi:alpha-1,6-mannosyltransferase